MAADPDADAFASELAALKRRGCSLLVVDPPGDSTLCEELLGDRTEPRCRIVVDSGEGRHDDPPDDHIVFEGVQRHTRSATATAASTGLHDQLNLPALRDRIEGAIDRVAEDDLEPGELRLCLGDLAPIAVGVTDDRVTDFLEGVTTAVEDVSGMAHVHVAPDTTTRDRIEDPFDVTIDLRSAPTGRQYRWHLHEADLDSGWLPLE